jgi:hypothetical protein
LVTVRNLSKVDVELQLDVRAADFDKKAARDASWVCKTAQIPWHV